ncbi:hypothetical protein CB1_001437016 [Camelus ferus]|nr:hypothetical protein CB1_001437016 [Camelus ferus]
MQQQNASPEHVLFWCWGGTGPPGVSGIFNHGIVKATRGGRAGGGFVEPSVLDAVRKVDSAVNSTRRRVLPRVPQETPDIVSPRSCCGPWTEGGCHVERTCSPAVTTGSDEAQTSLHSCWSKKRLNATIKLCSAPAHRTGSAWWSWKALSEGEQVPGPEGEAQCLGSPWQTKDFQARVTVGLRPCAPAYFGETLQGHLLLALVLLVQNIFCEKLVEIKNYYESGEEIIQDTGFSCALPAKNWVPVIETLAGATVPSSLTYPVFSACSAAGSSPSIVCSGHFHQTSPTVRGPCLTHMRLSLMFGSQGGEEQSGTSSTNEVFVSERFGDLYTGNSRLEPRPTMKRVVKDRKEQLSVFHSDWEILRVRLAQGRLFHADLRSARHSSIHCNHFDANSIHSVSTELTAIAVTEGDVALKVKGDHFPGLRCSE